MIVQCPNCQSKYNLPDNRIPAGGSKVRCTQCSHVFKVSPPVDDDLDALLNAGAEEAADDGGFGGRGAAGGASRASGAPADDDEFGFGGEDDAPSAKGRKGGDFSDVLGDEDEGGLSLDIGAGGGRKKKSGGGKLAGKKKLIVFGLVFVLLAGAGAGLWFSGVAGKLMGRMGGAAKEETKAEDVSPEARVKFIILENVRQYYVNNEKAGQLFVIEGKAVNQFEKPKELIKIEATLFDAAGKALGTRQQLCGNILSYFQLQVLSRTEIEAALANEMGVLNNNTGLETGGGTPFMVIFFDPPKDVAEFGVKVIEAHDPGAAK